MADLDIQVGDVVTLGLGTHDMEVQAWITFPSIGVTHEVDPTRGSLSCVHYRQIKTPVKHSERLGLLSVRNPKHLKGKVLEIREDDWGGEMVLIEFSSPFVKQRWFCPFLINCIPPKAP